jgi:lipoprotein-releasing system permease protein
MYKLLLCWRYLRTRYIVLVPILSIAFGVGIMIVVNSVMQGFAVEMQDRIHGIESDVVFVARSSDGIADFEDHAKQIRKVAGDDIVAMAPAVVTFGVLNYQINGQWRTQQVEVIGIDEKLQGGVGDFSRYLQHPQNRKAMSFTLRDGGYDIHDLQVPEAPERKPMAVAGRRHRLWVAEQLDFLEHERQMATPRNVAPTRNPLVNAASSNVPTMNPFGDQPEKQNRFDMRTQQHTGIVLGFAIVSYRTPDGVDQFLNMPGDDVKLTFPTVGQPPKATYDDFTVVDLYESKMSEYDSKTVFVPIRKLQELRGMVDPTTGVGLFNVIQIRLKPGANGDVVRDKLKNAFSASLYDAYTWRDAKGSLLAAVEMETRILNILLFMIIVVAGFGILAIFSMIVMEKTRDIGILKSLGASKGGVMSIFMSYGLLLGLVGSGVGLVGGLLFVRYINRIADFVGWLTGRPVFNPQIYYFYKIPTVVMPATVAWIVGGVITIAIVASILPARRAAGLHPVEALRYE